MQKKKKKKLYEIIYIQGLETKRNWLYNMLKDEVDNSHICMQMKNLEIKGVFGTKENIFLFKKINRFFYTFFVCSVNLITVIY